MNKETIETIIANLAEKATTLKEKKLEQALSMLIMVTVCFILSLEMLD